MVGIDYANPAGRIDPLGQMWLNPQWHEDANIYQRRPKTMTIALAMVGKASVVVATDSREMMQNTAYQGHRDDAQKLWRIGDVGLMIAGQNAGFCRHVIGQYVQNDVSKDRTFDQTLGTLSLCAAEYFRAHANPYEFMVFGKQYIEFVLAGYDNRGMPRISSLKSTTANVPFTDEPLRRYHVAGVFHVAQYWLQKVESELAAMGLEQLKELATFLIMETSGWHDMVGGPIQMAVITPAKGYQSIGDDEVEHLKRMLPRFAPGPHLMKALERHK